MEIIVRRIAGGRHGENKDITKELLKNKFVNYFMQGDTQNFLKLFKDFVIQTFPDNKITNNDSSLTTFGKPQEYSWERLQKLNDSGAGIFFSVNQFAMGRRRIYRFLLLTESDLFLRR
jgi:hypothetical protein